MPATPDLTIKFNLEGDKELLQALKNLDRANRKLQQGTVATTAAVNKDSAAKIQSAASTGMLDTRNLRLAKTNTVLANSFATLRSKLLLISFGAMLVERGIVSLVKAYGAQEAANLKLRAGLANVADTMPGVTQRLINYSSALQQTTAFGDEMITTGMVQFTTFGLNEKAIRALTPQVLNVARAIQTVSGQMPDLNSLFIAFGKATTTGIGTLTRYGVVLTETEREQLSLMDAQEKAVAVADILEKQYGGLAATYAKTTSGMLDLAAAARGDAAEAMGEAFAPMVLAASKALKSFFESINPQQVRLWTAAIAAASIAIGGYKVLIRLAKIETISFNAALASTPWGFLLVALSLVGAGILKLIGAFKHHKTVLSDADKKAIATIKTDMELIKVQKEGAESLEHRLKLLKATSPVEKILIGLKHEASEEEINLAEQIVETTYQLQRAKEASRERAKALTESSRAYKNALREVNAEIKRQQREQERLFPTQKAYRAEMEKSRLSGEHMQEMLRQYILHLNLLGIAHDLETDAMKAAREEQERFTAAKEDDLRITIAYNEHMKRQFSALDSLAIIEAERGHLLDGLVTLEEKLALNSLKVAQAEEKRADAMLKGDMTAVLDAERELLTLRKEFISLDPKLAKAEKLKARVASVEELVASYRNQLDIMEEVDPVQKELIKSAESLGMEYGHLKTLINMGVEGYGDLEGAIAAVLEEEKRLKKETLAATEALNEQFGVAKGLGVAFSSITSALGGMDFSAITKWQEAEKALLDEDTLENQQAFYQAQIDAKENLYTQMGGMATNFIQAEATRNEAAIRSQLARELDSLKQSTKYKIASDKEKENMEKAIVAQANERLKKQHKIQQAAAIASVWMDAIKASFKAVAGSWTSIGQPWAGIIMGMAALQTALIAAQKPPTAAQGGLVGGRRHTQGGTIIEAEQGEFIMSRGAVESIGIENLNRMNQGAGGGTINVSVSGNVLTQDFVENELAENIKDAIRRGTDFGIG